MTSNEAETIAETLLHHLTSAVELCDNQPGKVFSALNELLEQVVASKKGLIPADEPLGKVWSLMDLSLLEALRKHWLPEMTGLPYATDLEIDIKFSTDDK